MTAVSKQRQRARDGLADSLDCGTEADVAGVSGCVRDRPLAGASP